MDYGEILGRAWQIAWREKKLWVLGFMTHLGVLGIGAMLLGEIGEEESKLAGLLSCLGLWIWIALVVASIYARGGLIAGVQQAEDEGSVGFRRAWQAGRKRFGTLSGIGCLTGIPLTMLAMGIVGVLTLLPVVFLALRQEVPDPTVALGAAWFGYGGLVCCGWLVLALLMGSSQVYAERAAMLEGRERRDASRQGQQMLKANKGSTVVFLLINLVLEGIVLALFVGVLMLIDLPHISALRHGLVGHAGAASWSAGLICAVLIAVVLAALIGGVERAFTSAMWTLAYREMTRQADQPATPVKPGDL